MHTFDHYGIYQDEPHIFPAMTPIAARAALDTMLARNGVGAVLTRNTLAPGGVQIPVSVNVRVFANGYQPHEMIAGSGIVSGDTKVVMSFTEIEVANWPGKTPTNYPGDPRIPVKGDMVTINGHSFAVQSVAIRPLNSGIVMQVRG